MNCDKTISQANDPASRVNSAGLTASGREAGNGTLTPRSGRYAKPLDPAGYDFAVQLVSRGGCTLTYLLLVVVEINMGDLTCGHCGYRWAYTGDLIRATCPSCGGKVEVEKNGV